MSATTKPASKTTSEANADHNDNDKDFDLHARFLRALIEDPDAHDDIPNGCLLMIVPDDDAEHAEWVIARGADAVRDGHSVYFRHVRVAELPPRALPKPGAMAGVRRIEYNRDGTVRRVTVRGNDDQWHEVEPIPEDAADLPPLAMTGGKSSAP